MAKDDNTAGWILTTVVYALGGRMEVGRGTSRQGDTQQPQDRDGAQPPAQDALDGQLDGLHVRLRVE